MNGNCGHTHMQQHSRTPSMGRSQKYAWPQFLASGTGNPGSGRFEGPGLSGGGGRPGCACLVDKEDKTWITEAEGQWGLPPAKGKEGPLEPEWALDLPLGCPAGPLRAQTLPRPLASHGWPPTTPWTPLPLPPCPPARPPVMPAPDIHPHSLPWPDYSSISPNKVTFTALEDVPLGATTPPTAAGSQ